MFRNLIFDWSGTLVDDLGPVIEATNAVLAKYDVPALDRESFRRRFRLPYHEFYAEVLPDVPLIELESHFRPAFDSAVTPVTVLPHAREKLEWCRKLGIRVFVLTSMDTVAFERQMDEFELLPSGRNLKGHVKLDGDQGQTIHKRTRGQIGRGPKIVGHSLQAGDVHLVRIPRPLPPLGARSSRIVEREDDAAASIVELAAGGAVYPIGLAITVIRDAILAIEGEPAEIAA